MPELPEVETTVRQLREPCVGQRIVDVTINWARHIATPSPKKFRQHIRDQKIESITRRAKYLVFHLTIDSSSQRTLLGMTERSYLLIHLKMSGRLEVMNADSPRDKHDHTIFHFANGRELRFNDTRKFGKVYLVDDVNDVTGHLGPEPLEASFTAKRLGEILGAHHKPLKTFLLDQTLLAGVGNIYADESLHRAKIHPKRYSDSLKPDDVKKLWRSIRHTLNLAIKHNGSSIDWVYPQGEHQNHFRVYDRQDEPCYTCGKPVRRIIMGGRSTHFCSGCQRL
ncbi:MAG: DNA-formamidopyrimidine glycosylase [Chloroflexi bacterium]|nr:DNA-formamidopyrimidine glycosylase [Chloroflexota bacterium]MBI5349850.1 DNA-formamidopyrimidine glycosylase [Chloroflexota bacterium]